MEEQVQQELQQHREKIESLLTTVLAKPEPGMLYEPMRYTLSAGGKRLRPLLVLLSCEAVGGKPEQAIHAAAAVELLHNFTLIHDDVMDFDEMRRGQPTVHKRWDVGVAILSGDGLVALSYETLFHTKTGNLREIGVKFSRALLEICEGQALDKKFESLSSVTIEEYFEMIRKKTASLMALCCELGGLIAEAPKEHIEILRSFGMNLGMAFQIQDDLLDIMAEESQIGKSWGSDVKHKKKTLIILEAIRLANETVRDEIQSILKKDEIVDSDVVRIRELYIQSGAIRASQHHLDRYFSQAKKDLDALPLTEGVQLLSQLLNHVISRSN